MRDILSFLVWWFVVSSAGMLVWPLVFRMLALLPERGYALSKTGGLLLIGYTFWILSSLGYLQFTVGGVLVAGLIVAIVALRWGHPRAAMEWLRAHRVLVLATEGVFLVSFAIWAYVRALNPEIVGTEKPMEFAFLNSVLRGGVMPPRDPWLSGYAISYYYFGYVIIGMLTRVSGVLPSVGFNLAVAMLFGLVAVGSFGVVLNLIVVASRSSHRGAALQSPVSRFALPAILAPIFTVVTGNLSGFLEVIHQRGMGAAFFWRWLGIKWLEAVPTPSDVWLPQRYLWWWQASRVIRDRDISGSPIGLQPIDEFPFFSFLLGDLHPHVLALPFVFLAIGVAMQMYLIAANREPSRYRWLPLPASQMLFFAVVLGGLGFLNTWDFPIYLGIAIMAYAAGRAELGPRELRLSLMLAALGGLLYLPFYLGFRSQAGGILPNALFPTQLNQFSVMFGVLLVPVLGWLLWESARARRALNWRLGMTIGLGVLGGLVVCCAMLTTVILTIPYLRETHGVSVLLGTLSIDEALLNIMRRRILDVPWTALLLTAMLLLAGGLVGRKTARPPSRVAATPFVALLCAVGAVLTLGPEFLYLRDSFGARMNTIFKLYYQAWALWSIVAAFGCWRIWRNAGRKWRIVFWPAVAISLTAGLFYSALSIWTKTAGMRGTTLIGGERLAKLDGMAWMTQSQPEVYEALYWLNHFLPTEGVIGEAVGGSYSDYGRVSAHTGMATVLGWPGHELQWRGGFELAAGREEAVKTLYSTRAWDEALTILSLYDIRYVYVGELERQQFPAYGLAKFEDYMQLIFRNSAVAIYERMD